MTSLYYCRVRRISYVVNGKNRRNLYQQMSSLQTLSTLLTRPVFLNGDIFLKALWRVLDLEYWEVYGLGIFRINHSFKNVYTSHYWYPGLDLWSPDDYYDLHPPHSNLSVDLHRLRDTCNGTGDSVIKLEIMTSFVFCLVQVPVSIYWWDDDIESDKVTAVKISTDRRGRDGNSWSTIRPENHFSLSFSCLQQLSLGEC